MNTLVINAVNDKILFSFISGSKCYTTDHANCRQNFDKLIILLTDFLSKHNSNIEKISEIFVNQGPGKISSIRSSIAVAKGIAFSKNIDLYGFFSDDLKNKSIRELIKVSKKKFTNINLIKPLYSS